MKNIDISAIFGVDLTYEELKQFAESTDGSTFTDVDLTYEELKQFFM